MIDRVCDEASQEEIGVAWFYSDFRDQHEQTAANIIGANGHPRSARGSAKGISKGKIGARRPRPATSGYGRDSEVSCYHIIVGFRLH